MEELENFEYYNSLFLVYKDLIKDSNREIFDLYYGENLTMQEIADLKNISKARVGTIIKNVEKKLVNYEEKLKIVLNNQKLESLLKIDDINLIKEQIDNILKGE